MSLVARQALTKALTFPPGDTLGEGDLLDPARTSTDLIAALTIAVRTFGFKSILVTSVRSDHGDDSSLGFHTHSRGYAADVWPNTVQGPIFIGELLHNPYVTKVGLGGEAQAWYPMNGQDAVETADGKVVFLDNSTDHVHVQVS